MNDSITIRGIVATDPRHLVTGNGLAITSLRLASPSRRWDRSSMSWTNGDTNWFTVTAFRSLATNLHRSLSKGDRVIVSGRLRVRNWERDDRSGMSVEIDADAVGHDLAYGRGTWIRVPRHTTDESAPPGDSPRPADAESLDTAGAAASVSAAPDPDDAGADGDDPGGADPGGAGDDDDEVSDAGIPPEPEEPLRVVEGVVVDVHGVVTDTPDDDDARRRPF